MSTSHNPSVIVVTQPRSSSGLGGYIVDALRRTEITVEVVDGLSSKPFKFWPVVKSLRWPPALMWQRRWENLLFSSWAWRRNSQRNAELIEKLKKPGARILQISKEYFPHPVNSPCAYDIFILYTMKLSLADGITPWLPPVNDRERFLALETELYRRARFIFTGGAYVKDHLVREYSVDPDRVVPVGGGVHPYYLEQAVDKSPDDFTKRILFVGWDFGMKGGRDLLDAFAIVRRERPDLTLVVAGPGRDQQVSQDGVQWTGPIPSRDGLIDLYRTSDIFVMPSLRDSYGFVFLEAMTQGVPCIGTNLNAMPEIISEGETGYLVPLRDPPALAHAILRYYNDSGNRRRMGEAALSRVKRDFTWDRVIQRMNPHLFDSGEA